MVIEHGGVAAPASPSPVYVAPPQGADNHARLSLRGRAVHGLNAYGPEQISTSAYSGVRKRQDKVGRVGGVKRASGIGFGIVSNRSQYVCGWRIQSSERPVWLASPVCSKHCRRACQDEMSEATRCNSLDRFGLPRMYAALVFRAPCNRGVVLARAKVVLDPCSRPVLLFLVTADVGSVQDGGVEVWGWGYGGRYRYDFLPKGMRGSTPQHHIMDAGHRFGV